MIKAYAILALLYNSTEERNAIVKELQTVEGVKNVVVLQEAASEFNDAVLTVEAKDLSDLQRIVYQSKPKYPANGIRYIEGVMSVAILVWAELQPKPQA